MRIIGPTTLLVSALALAVPTGAAEAGDAANGSVIARRWCAECHVVSPDQTRATVDAPTFADIARRRTPATGDALQRFLMDPHPRMPDMQIGRREADDLVAYIATQRYDAVLHRPAQPHPGRGGRRTRPSRDERNSKPRDQPAKAWIAPLRSP